MNGRTSSAINTLKFICLIGVIMIHCNPMIFLGNSAGENAVMTFDVISAFLALCVPFFFVLSGFLFFNFDSFDFRIILRKWKTRVRSLVVPYLLWCTLYGLLRIVKGLYLGYDGDGIVVDGHVSMLGFLRGYWDTGDGYPMGFALWFVRNLIVFVALAPAVYFVARRWWTAALFLCLPLLDVNLYGIEYFVLGATLGLHKVELSSIVNKHVGLWFLLWGVALVAAALYFPEAVFALRYAGFMLSICLVAKFDSFWPRMARLISENSNVFFFIYAIHGMYCPAIDKVFIKILTPDNVLVTLACFILSLLTNLILSYIIFLVAKAVSPRFIDLLSGGRFIKKTRA